jgi:hypothetical protein
MRSSSARSVWGRCALCTSDPLTYTIATIAS